LSLTAVPRFSSQIQKSDAFADSHGFEKILVFYLPLKDGIELVRVVHGNRDLQQLFGEGFCG
jgi:hypothetical protein